MVQLYPDFSVLGVSATPNLCFICGSPKGSTDEGIASTGKFIDFEGALELCKSCVLELANLFGALGPDKAGDLRRNNRSLGQQLRAALSVEQSLRTQIEALQDQVEALRPVKK